MTNTTTFPRRITLVAVSDLAICAQCGIEACPEYMAARVEGEYFCSYCVAEWEQTTYNREWVAKRDDPWAEDSHQAELDNQADPFLPNDYFDIPTLYLMAWGCGR